MNEVESNTANSNPRISMILNAGELPDNLASSIQDLIHALRNRSVEFEILILHQDIEKQITETLKPFLNETTIDLINVDLCQSNHSILEVGIKNAKMDVAVFATCEFDFREIDRILHLSENYDVVWGYRINPKQSVRAKACEAVYGFLARVLLPVKIRDLNCGFHAIRSEKFASLTFSNHQILSNTQLLTEASLGGTSVVEVGVTHRKKIQPAETASFIQTAFLIIQLVRYWWRRIQFPEGGNKSTTPSINDKTLKKVPSIGWKQIIFVAIAAALLLTNLDYPLIDRDETRYAEIPREMFSTGDWILPQLNFKPYYDKPPLLYWLCASSYKFFGVAAWSARLIPALCSLATIMVTMWFGTRWFGNRVGLLGGIVLLFSLGFSLSSRMLLIDNLLTLTATISLFSAYEAIRTKPFQTGFWILSAVACGLGFLSKGPLSLVLLIPPLITCLYFSDEKHRPSIRAWVGWAAIVILITSPWYIAVAFQDAHFLYEFFWRHNVARFGGEFHSKPFWYYVPVALIGLHPWTFLMVGYVSYLFSRQSWATEKRTRTDGLLFLSCAWCFVFFSASSCKLATYLLPALPAAALLIARYLDVVWFSKTENPGLRLSRTISSFGSFAMTLAIILGLSVYSCYIGLESSFFVLLIGVGAMFATAIAWVTYIRDGEKFAWGLSLIVIAAFSTLLLHRELPQYANHQTVFGPTSTLTTELGIDPKTHIVTVAHEWSGVPFYLSRDDVLNFSNEDSTDFEHLLETQDQTIVIAPKSLDKFDIQAHIPKGKFAEQLSERGPAKLYLVQPMIKNDD